MRWSSRPTGTVASRSGSSRVAYLDPTEDVAEREWQALVHDDLVRDKLAAFDEIRTLLAGGRPGTDGTIGFVLDAEQEEHLLGALNDLRLVLAELIDGDDEPSMRALRRARSTPPASTPATSSNG